ncbi:peroxidase [Anopheles nili]|uniref:peroxidase n=1 Tax=Anopheles nili TaxID=185578 RepID=UPI00237AD6CF|nr:peroxidase [Anopheles nili]
MHQVLLSCLVAVALVVSPGYVTSLAISDRIDRYQLDPPFAAKMDRFTTKANLEMALDFSETVFEMAGRSEESLAASPHGKVTKGGTTYAQIIDGYPTPSTRQQDLLARKILRASSFFASRFCSPNGVPSYECGLYLSGTQLPPSAIGNECHELITEKEHNDQYRRLLPAVYDNGLYSFRRSTNGSALPQAREISARFHVVARGDRKDLDNTRSVALVQWSQFIEHDLAKTTVQTTNDGTHVECCSAEHGQLLPRYRHPACEPMLVPADDPYYGMHRATCLNYVRSALSVGADSCTMGPANQLNQATNRLDLSQLYGNLAEDTHQLRVGKGGRLKAQLFDSVEYLQETPGGRFCVPDANLETACYDSGDTRVNVNPYITLLHTLFLRSHNRLAKHLALLKPAWTDEQLFGVARTINTRLYQKIVREWLAVIVGGNQTSFSADPSNEQDDRVSNEFATAAIRFYNTMMPGEISNATTGTYDLEKLFYRPKDLRKRDYFGQLVGSVLGQNAMALDTSYVDDMAHLLFGVRHVGLDVLALDIQRGRDHGLARYTDYFTLCNGKPVTSWSDLERVLKPADLEIIRTAYATVHDVDLIVGAIAEWPSVGATVGPTLSCLIREQIERSLSMSDGSERENASLLRQDRLDAWLAEYSAVRFMCDTAQVERVQRDIFHVPAVDNPLVQCVQLPPLDLAGLV